MRVIAATFVLALAASGCLYGDAQVGYSAGYVAPAPAMVEVSPGVMVIQDYDYPVFYSDNAYWRYDNGLWYRSSMYNGGWAISYNVPYAVGRIDRPHTYAHYRAGGNANWGRPAQQGYRPAPTYRPGPSARPGPSRPIVRDHRH
jgi:hypothetical protein